MVRALLVQFKYWYEQVSCYPDSWIEENGAVLTDADFGKSVVIIELWLPSTSLIE